MMYALIQGLMKQTIANAKAVSRDTAIADQ
jgi:hypothetical protein